MDIYMKLSQSTGPDEAIFGPLAAVSLHGGGTQINITFTNEEWASFCGLARAAHAPNRPLTYIWHYVNRRIEFAGSEFDIVEFYIAD